MKLKRCDNCKKEIREHGNILEIEVRSLVETYGGLRNGTYDFDSWECVRKFAEGEQGRPL